MQMLFNIVLYIFFTSFSISYLLCVGFSNSTKDDFSYNSICIKYLEKAKSERWKVDWWFIGAEGRWEKKGSANRYIVSFGGDKNILELMMIV